MMEEHFHCKICGRPEPEKNIQKWQNDASEDKE